MSENTNRIAALTSPEQIEDAISALRRDGFVHLKQLFPPSRIRAIAADYFRLYPSHATAADMPSDRSYLGDGRYTMPVINDGDLEVKDVILTPGLIEVLDAILYSNWVIEAYGAIASFPGSKKQVVHPDGEKLFPEIGIDNMLPASALTIAIPLVSINQDNGRTSFYPGTHRDPTKIPEPISVDLETGDCQIWEYRVFHSGEANRTDTPRHMLYLTCCRPYWTDNQAFEPGVNSKLLSSSSALEGMSGADLKRFARAELVAD